MSKSLLPPNATELDKAAEKVAVDALDSIPHMHRAVWSADHCPAPILPWLAWTVGVESWRPEWPEAIKRSRIKTSISIHRRKGTVKAVTDAVRSFGGQIGIREWWQTTPRGIPHTFEVVLTVPDTGITTTEDFVNDVIEEVNRTKPKRSHFTFVMGLSAKLQLEAVAVGRPAIFRRLDMVIE